MLDVVLGHVSNEQLALVWIAAVISFLDKHLTYGLLAGFAWLTVVCNWPRWKPSWIKLPVTSRERIGAVEAKLDQNRGQTLAGLAHVQSQMALYADKIDAVSQRIDEHRDWLTEPQCWHRAVLKESPTSDLFMTEIGIVISQASEAICLLSFIDRYLPESEAAKAPFSQRWSSPDSQPPSDPVLIRWMILMDYHLWTCSKLADGFGVG